MEDYFDKNYTDELTVVKQSEEEYNRLSANLLNLLDQIEQNEKTKTVSKLWQELKNRENNSGVTVQNTMRRIIENYFKILGKYGDDDLVQAFDNHGEQEICRSLICWINDRSHTIPDDLYIEHNDAITVKYFQVFESIFNKLGQPEHYGMMMAN